MSVTYLSDLARALGKDSPFWTPAAPSFPQAICTEEYPDIWFPQWATPDDEHGVSTAFVKSAEAAAVSMCFDCPHMIECGDYAVKNRIEFGVFGGLTEADRAAIWAKEDEGVPE